MQYDREIAMWLFLTELYTLTVAYLFKLTKIIMGGVKDHFTALLARFLKTLRH